LVGEWDYFFQAARHLEFFGRTRKSVKMKEYVDEDDRSNNNSLFK
jgi:hypothetical protein